MRAKEASAGWNQACQLRKLLAVAAELQVHRSATTVRSAEVARDAAAKARNAAISAWQQQLALTDFDPIVLQAWHGAIAEATEVVVASAADLEKAENLLCKDRHKWLMSRRQHDVVDLRLRKIQRAARQAREEGTQMEISDLFTQRLAMSR